VKKKKKSNQSTSYNIPIKFVFVGILLISCIGCDGGWSVAGWEVK
tara:strand:- start:1 stop:135 length:135 start_codon:yes stop_codon:yes gene_type:complete